MEGWWAKLRLFQADIAKKCKNTKKKLDKRKLVCYSYGKLAELWGSAHLPWLDIRLAGLASPARLQEKCSPSPRSGERPGGFRVHSLTAKGFNDNE